MARGGYFLCAATIGRWPTSGYRVLGKHPKILPALQTRNADMTPPTLTRSCPSPSSLPPSCFVGHEGAPEQVGGHLRGRQ